MSDGESEASGEDEAPDLETRRLCPDGACTGLIGDDGRCKECGRAAGDGADAPLPPRYGADDDHASAEPAGDPGELADRRLCPDGACIGLIGDDGRCKECGRSTEPIGS